MKRSFLTVIALALLTSAAPAHALDRHLELLAPPGIPDPGTHLTALSADGKVAFFLTAAAASADDTDGGAPDIYAFSGGTTTLISDRVQAGPDASDSANYEASS